MPLFDNRRAKVSFSLLIIGGFIVAALVTLGLVIRVAIHKTATHRLRYEYPDGYSENKDMQWCTRRQDGEGKFSDEYYMWNLTNLDEVLAGKNANYNLAGPYFFANHTCDFEWEKDGDFLRYRRAAYGFHFLPDQSGRSQYDKITNINPGYLGLLKAAGSESGIIALMSGGALRAIITGFQKPDTIANVQALSRPTVLANMNTQLLPVFAAGVSLGVMTNIFAAGFPPGTDEDTKHNAVFNNPAGNIPVASLGSSFRGYANFINTTFGSVPAPLSNATMNQLVATWSVNGDGTGIYAFVKAGQANISTIAINYGVSGVTATFLLAYAGKYLMNPQGISLPFVQMQFYSQWANGTRPQIPLGGGLTGWELGIPNPSYLSAATVAKLFDPTYPYSLTNDTLGATFWIGVLQGNVTLPLAQGVIDPSLTQTQFTMLRGWLFNFQTTIVPPLLLQKFGITDWNDFAYAQWGGLVLGKSVGPAQQLTYYPELAAFDPTPIGKPPSCVQYTVAEAKALLNGSNPLLNPTQTAYFLAFAKSKNYAFTKSLYGLDENKTDCLYAYLTQVISPKAVVPSLTQILQSGGGLFTTRTVQEWLFTAKDPLLTLLGQPADVAMVGNKTESEESARKRDKDFIRIYTGKNDLYSSLQPPDFGANVHGFWAEDIAVEGYNGTQFLPYDYVKKESSAATLQLWHHKVMRPVKVKYYGMTKWQGIDVAYIAIHPADLASMYINPANAKYFSQYGGLINESSFITNKGLPVFLSLPGFNLAEPRTTENLTLVDHIFDHLPENPSESFSRHRYQVFVLVEPYLGAALWGNVPIQANFQYGPTDIFYTKVKPNFAPVFWNAIGDQASKENTDHLKDTLYAARKLSKAMLAVGAGLGGLLMIAGIVGLILFRNKYKHTSADDKLANSRL